LHGLRSELNSVFDLEKVDWWNPVRTFAIQSRWSWAIAFLFSSLQSVSLWSISVLSFCLLGFPSGCFQRGFTVKVLSIFLSSLILASYLAHY